MNYYHGTVAAYLASIQKEGLKPTPAHSYVAHGFDLFYGVNYDEFMSIQHGVYLVDNKTFATKFAQYKTAWLGSPKPGLVITGDEPDSQTFHLYKAYATKLVETTPIVLTINLPDSITRALNPDLEGDPKHMFWYPGIIPATAITAIAHPRTIPFQTLTLSGV